jgi:hypothetical protein
VYWFHFPPDILQETSSLCGFGVAGDALGSAPLIRAQPVNRAVNSSAQAIAFITNDLLDEFGTSGSSRSERHANDVAGYPLPSRILRSMA